MVCALRSSPESFLPNVNGVSNSVLRVLEHLRRTGHEALVIAPDNPPDEPRAERVHDGVRVHRVPSRMFPKVTSLPLGIPWPRMVAVLRGFDPDVVHLASPALLGYGGLHRRAVPRACRQSRCSKPTSRVSRRATAWVSRPGSRGRGPGTCTRGPTGPWRRPPLRWKTLPRIAFRGCTNGPRELMSPVSRRRPAVPRCGAGWSPDGKPIVGFVGRLAPEKHVERLAALARRDDLQLVIVGDGVDRAKLETAMPSAVFTGALYGPELAAAYASMDVFVHPGEHETFCQAVQEAMASGLPVIAPDAGGPRDLVTPMQTGILLGVNEFEQRLSPAVDHLIAERQSICAGRATQRAGPHLAGDLRRVAGPLRGRHRRRRRAAGGAVVTPAVVTVVPTGTGSGPRCFPPPSSCVDAHGSDVVGGIRPGQPCANSDTGCHCSQVLIRCS